MMLFSKVVVFLGGGFCGVKLLGQMKKDLENFIYTKHIEGEKDGARRAWIAERHGDAWQSDKRC